jgi:hypothetical protein
VVSGHRNRDHGPAERPCGFGELDPVNHPRQLEVSHEHIDRVLAQHGQGAVPIRRRHHMCPSVHEVSPPSIEGHLVVVDEQHSDACERARSDRQLRRGRSKSAYGIARVTPLQIPALYAADDWLLTGWITNSLRNYLDAKRGSAGNETGALWLKPSLAQAIANELFELLFFLLALFISMRLGGSLRLRRLRSILIGPVVGIGAWFYSSS